MARFADRVVVVIGGNSGIGLAAARQFVSEGASVVVTGTNADTLREAAEELGDILAMRCDVSDVGAIDGVIEGVRARHGRIDALFVSAGVGAFVPVEDVTPEMWDRMMAINLKGAYFAIQKALPLMARGGAIVLCGSIGGRIGLPGNSVYGASKAGLASLAFTLGAELVSRGIRVNCVSPGPTRTPIIHRTAGVDPADAEAMLEMMSQSVPMKRIASPDEIANLVLFLASDEASFITGRDMVADGGICSFVAGAGM